MGKNAVYWTIEPYHYNKNRELKKLSLLFDKIYFRKPLTKVTPSDIIGDNIKNRGIILEINDELKLYEYLQKRNVIEEYDSIPATKTDITSENELEYLTDYLNQLREYAKTPIWTEDHDTIIKRFQTSVTVHDIQTRVDSIALSRKHNSEFYPIIKSNGFYTERAKKTQVVHFTLDKIPEPSENTSWDQIIEFRSDKNVRNKYLTLVKWINNVTISSATFSDIQDEYESLYSDYMKYFTLHQLKYNFSKIEMIVGAGIDFLASLASGQFIPAFNNLLKMKLSNINLLQEEANIPGKEIAYIYHANQKFNKE